MAFASWWNPFSWGVFNRQAVIKTENTSIALPSTSTKEVLKETSSLPIEKAKYVQPQRVKEKPENLPIIEIHKTDSSVVQETNLKIEQCKAVKEKTFNDATLKLNQTVDSRLEEVFNSINNQTEDEVKRINNDANAKISSVSDNYLFYNAYYNDNASYKLDKLHRDQQSFWYSQKREIENSKQKAIDQINSLLSEEYIKCLNK